MSGRVCNPDGVGWPMSRPVCLFAHFAPDRPLSASLLHYLVQLTKCGMKVHLAVSGMQRISEEDSSHLEQIGVEAHPRPNEGLDFGAWQHLIRIGCAQDAECVLLANDSVLGPVCELPPIFTAMQAKSRDVWGMIESHEIAWHLQSWFVCLSRAAFERPAVQRVFNLPFAKMSKQEIILHGEIGLGTAIRSEDLSWDACLRDSRRGLRRLIAVNPMHVDWATALACGQVPFLKLELLRDNPAKIPWLPSWPGCLRRAGGFPDDWIAERLPRRAGDPHTGFKQRLFYALLSRDRGLAWRTLLAA